MGSTIVSKVPLCPQEMPDFYRFQLREKRREEIIDHRKRKAKDLETVKQMKKASGGAAGRSGPPTGPKKVT